MLAKVLCSLGRCAEGRRAAELALERDRAVAADVAALTAAERSDVQKVLESQAPDSPGGGEFASDGGIADISLGPLQATEFGTGKTVLELGPASSQSAKQVRCKPFGHKVQGSATETSALREAALSDIERVFSNLMPSNAVFSSNERRGPAVQMGCAQTLCCRKSTIIDI